MTTPDDHDVRRSPSGFVTGRVVDALQQIEEAGAAVQNSLPVRLYHPADGAGENVVAHFQYETDQGWSVFGDLTRGRHGLVISRMEILTDDGSSGVTAGLLRRIPIGEVLSAVRAKAAWESARREGTRVVLGQEPAPGLFSDADVKPPRRGGRAPMTPELLRDVARAYLQETAPGMPAGAAKRMAEQFDRPEETIRTWITRARKDGWLGPSTKGRAGAEPGPKLIQWLGEQMNSDETLLKDFAATARALGADDPEAVAAAVLPTWRSPFLSDFPHRSGIAPSEMLITAQVLYGRSADAELAARVEAGQDEDAVFEQIAAEVRAKIAQHEQ